jgi:histidyl-tRNA synthetase
MGMCRLKHRYWKSQYTDGKYGEEGDRLLFKVLNNGDYLGKADDSAYQNKDSNKFTPSIAKRGMRYDLTVPFARYVVMHRNDINLPFKRYQIQPVWRADRPQKGATRNFISVMWMWWEVRLFPMKQS